MSRIRPPGRSARAHDDLFEQAQPLLKKILTFLENETHAQAIYEGARPIGFVAEDETEMDRIVAFIARSAISQGTTSASTAR